MWTLPFTHTGFICFASYCASCVHEASETAGKQQDSVPRVQCSRRFVFYRGRSTYIIRPPSLSSCFPQYGNHCGRQTFLIGPFPERKPLYICVSRQGHSFVLLWLFSAFSQVLQTNAPDVLWSILAQAIKDGFPALSCQKSQTHHLWNMERYETTCTFSTKIWTSQVGVRCMWAWDSLQSSLWKVNHIFGLKIRGARCVLYVGDFGSDCLRVTAVSHHS